jgi:hypothetical protein
VLSQPATASQEHDAPDSTTRAASPEIQEAEEGLGIALSQGAASGEVEASSSPAPRGRLPSRPVTTPRTARRPRCATPLTVGWHGRAARLMI